MVKFTPESTVALNSGYKMPVVGLGIDLADWYDNEAGCGAAIRAVATMLPREQIFFTSKVPYTKMSYATASALIDSTLAKTGLPYIDLFLVHSPYGGSANRKAVWRALVEAVEAVEAGKVRSIGVSNYGLHHLAELETHIAELEEERGGKGKGGVISVGQREIHPWLARPDIVAWCRERNVAVQAYCPLVRGKKWGEPVLTGLAAKYAVSEAQVLVRWSMRSFVPLPKSFNAERIKANIDVFGLALTDDEVAQLDTGEYNSVIWDPTVEPLEE